MRYLKWYPRVRVSKVFRLTQFFPTVPKRKNKKDLLYLYNLLIAQYVYAFYIRWRDGPKWDRKWLLLVGIRVNVVPTNQWVSIPFYRAVTAASKKQEKWFADSPTGNLISTVLSFMGNAFLTSAHLNQHCVSTNKARKLWLVANESWFQEL